MSEKQYQSYFDYPAEKMGPMTSQYWRDDPKLLGIHLARYKFVSKMLAGKKRVAEVGCGDGWFSKLVREQVSELDLYDFDKRFIDWIYSIGGNNAYCQDILHSPLQYGNYEAIYSLDVFEHIDPEKEHVYLKNICKSLDEDGVFICGMPSIESQVHASKASKDGHCNCKASLDLKTILEKYFKQVFIFGFNDEMLHVGFDGMRHYNMALACGLK